MGDWWWFCAPSIPGVWRELYILLLRCPLGVRVARLRCHLQVDRWTARDSGGQAVVRVPWVDRKRRVVDESRQQRDGGCAVVTITAPPLGATGVI